MRWDMEWGPASANGSPARFVFLRSQEAKERLRPMLAPGIEAFERARRRPLAAAPQSRRGMRSGRPCEARPRPQGHWAAGTGEEGFQLRAAVLGVLPPPQPRRLSYSGSRTRDGAIDERWRMERLTLVCSDHTKAASGLPVLARGYNLFSGPRHEVPPH